MATRNFAQVAPTAATIALNAYIYGYGGHSLVTPHAALKRLWWTDERIDAKVTRAYVVSKLRGEERDFLDKPLGFGEGLTDDTYMEWILERAKRLFLILAEIGVPDQIFGCIDDSWGDDDLPIPLKDIKSLELSLEEDDVLNKKFYDAQHVYLLRELKEGAHIEYGPNEHIPMEHVNTLPPAVHLQPYDRVHFPNRPDDVFMRRKYPFHDKVTGQCHGDTFMRDVKRAKRLPHEHIARIWATYLSEDAGFMLSDFVPEHTLRSFIEHRMPPQFSRVPPSDRAALLMEWMHCLADALASLHHRGVAHAEVRPSNIWIDKHNKIAFADVGTIETLQRNKKSPKTEVYDYSAPEQQISRTPIVLKTSSPPASNVSAFSRLRKKDSMSVGDANSSISGSSGSSSTRSNSVCNNSSPMTPVSTYDRRSSLSTFRTAFSGSASDAQSPISNTHNFSRLLPTALSTPISPTSTHFSLPSSIDPDSLRNLPVATPFMSDIYSLACVYLDLMTFLLKGKNSDFIRFRSTSAYSTSRDTSFHSQPDRIHAWIDLLEQESLAGPHQPTSAAATASSEILCHGIPALLHLIRLMLCQNATLRPNALSVRDRIQAILVGESGVEKLCCAGRVWGNIEDAEETDEDDERRRSSRRHALRHDRAPAEDISVAAARGGIFRKKAPAQPSESVRRSSTSHDQYNTEKQDATDGMSLRSTAATSTLTAKRSGWSRRGSEVSTATATTATSPSNKFATVGSWRKRFLRY